MVHQQPNSKSESPEVQGMPTKSSNDDFPDLRIAFMELGDPSDEMLRVSEGLRSFVKKGQDWSIYSTAEALYDCGLARSISGNKALQERQAFGKLLTSKMPANKREDKNIGRDTDGDSVQEHEPGDSMGNNASISGLPKLSDEFARSLDLLEKGTLDTDPQSSQTLGFIRDLAKRKLSRQTQNAKSIGDLVEGLTMTDGPHDPALKATYLLREIEVSNFNDSFDFWYRSASSGSKDKRTSVRSPRKTKMPEHKETVEELPRHILHEATAIKGDFAVLISYLNWINRPKVWGLLDEGRYRAYYLVKRLLNLVEDGPVPQSILEALDAPVTCAISLSSSESHTVTIDGAFEHYDSSTGQESSTFEDKLRQALNQMRNTSLETDGLTEMGDLNRRRIRKLMRMLLPRSVLATFSEDMSKAVHDLFFAFNVLNTMRPNLYNVRTKAKTAVTAWARASFQAWSVGYGNWQEVPVTQKYEQQRIEYLAMCENAKILHEKLAPRLRFFQGNWPRVRVAKAGSHPDKRCKRVRKSWDMHIRDVKNMFPLVTTLIWEAGALVYCGARVRFDLDGRRNLKERLLRWKSMDEDEDCMADEEGKEYWDMLLPCTRCS